MAIYTHVPPDLHPDSVKAIPEYDEETAPLVAPAVDALTTVYEGLNSIHVARQAARDNPTLNEAAQVIQTADYAEKVTQRAAKRVDSILGSMKTTIASLEASLTAPLDQAAGSRPINSEIRAHVKSLSNEDRMKWFSNALKTGDTLSLVAVLGAPGYLAGFSSEMQAALTRQFHEATNPQAAKRLRVMRAAYDIVADRAPQMFQHAEKLIGMDTRKVQRLRQAKTKAEEAFILRTDNAAV